MDMQRLRGYLGLAARAGQLTYGTDAVCRMIRERKTPAVLIDSGASANTVKKVTDTCKSHDAAYYLLEEGEISSACGKTNVMVAAFAKGSLCEAAVSAIES